MDPSDFPHESTGVIQFDPGIGTRHFEPWWALLACDPGIVDYYSWLLLRHGIALHRGSHWGPHVCFIRGQEPPDKAAWGRASGAIPFRYSNRVRWDNGRHAWLDVWSPELAAVRESLGFPAGKTTFHLTLGRLVFPKDSTKTADPDGLLVL
ncbi:MAG TPA: hypothetical protein VKE74_20115 [Gemmataceae bacterium]|nr:hypothetical protein [Gemmataceae bacterium]